MLQNLLDMMVAEEEHLKEQLLKSVAAYRKELDGLCTELQAEPFQVRDAAPRAGGHSRRLSARPPAGAVWGCEAAGRDAVLCVGRCVCPGRPC